MARIALFGATSTIARDLIASFSGQREHELFLYARRPHAVIEWLAGHNIDLAGRSFAIEKFGDTSVDLVVNCVGIGDPKRAMELGTNILRITQDSDDIVLDYVDRTPGCHYLFLSSGAVYGGSFTDPVTEESAASIAINHLKPQDYYGLAKLMTEIRHRLRPDLPIIDIRVFNYFSRYQDLSARFLASDLVRCLQNKEMVTVSPDPMVRDFIHPSDFVQAVSCLMQAQPFNGAVDCYSAAPVDKNSLLQAFGDRYGLRYQLSQESNLSPNATGSKPSYYSLNHRLSDFGYKPRMTSLEALFTEIDTILRH